MKEKTLFNSTLLSFILLLTLASNVDAQLYKTTFGMRFDDEQLGFSLSQKFAKTVSAEAFFDADKSELRYGGVLKHHSRIAGRRLNWYQAAGLHSGRLKNSGPFWGVNFMIGAEYKFFLFPMVISFDLHPMLNVSDSHPDYLNMQTVFSIKYIIIKDKKLKLNKIGRKESDPD